MRTPNDEKNEALYDFVTLHGSKQLTKSIRQAHDWILYDSEIPIDQEQKDVLHDLKLLADQLEKTK
jgi:hypothetical protein